MDQSTDTMYQLCIGLISFPLQFRGPPPIPNVALRGCAMLEFGCPKVAGPAAGR